MRTITRDHVYYIIDEASCVEPHYEEVIMADVIPPIPLEPVVIPTFETVTVGVPLPEMVPIPFNIPDVVPFEPPGTVLEQFRLQVGDRVRILLPSRFSPYTSGVIPPSEGMVSDNRWKDADYVIFGSQVAQKQDVSGAVWVTTDEGSPMSSRDPATGIYYQVGIVKVTNANIASLEANPIIYDREQMVYDPCGLNSSVSLDTAEAAALQDPSLAVPVYHLGKPPVNFQM